MLAGMMDEFSGQPVGPSGVNMGIGPSMFETLGTGRSSFAPDPHEMAARMQQLQVHRKVTLKQVVVRTYMLNDDGQRTQYEADLEHLVLGMSLHTHVPLWRPPPQFIASGPDGKPGYVAHMEWMEFELHESPAAVVGQQRESGVEHEHKDS